jgi:hypothetical protein
MPVALTEKDERAFLSYLRDLSDIRILSLGAPGPELLTFDDLPPRKSGEKRFFIQNLQFPWMPRMERSHLGTYYLENYLSGPGIEYSRDPLGAPGPDDHGRFFWPTYPDKERLQADPHTPYCYDHDAFRPWYEKIVRWVLNNGRRGWFRNRRYYLPDAYLRHGWYRVL